jgi:threonine dehydrogenase-like Zn-dependent dehydrogenase
MARMMGKSFGRPVVFECVGAPGILQTLIEASPAGGQIVVAGVCLETDKIEAAIINSKRGSSSCEKVGDSLADLRAAKAAGVRALCVSYGYSPNVDLREHAPDALVDRMTDLLPLLLA